MATGIRTQSAQPGHRADDRRARLVWLVLAGASIAFVVACMMGILAIASFIDNDTVAMSARIEPLRGGRLAVLRHDLVVPELITSTKEIREGDVATTGGESIAFLQVFDGSTIQTYFSSTLEISALRTGRYSHNRKEVSVNLRAGTAIMVTADEGGYESATYRINTERAEISLASGSKARITVDTEQSRDSTTAVVDYGEAVLVANGRTWRVGPGMMVTVEGEKPPAEPAPSEEELLRNGHFVDPPTSGAESLENGGLGTAGWLPIREVSTVPVDDPGTVSVVTEELPGYPSLKAVRFQRMDRSDHYIKVGIRQEVNRPTAFHKSLELFATVRIFRQTTPIGGPQGNLYPLTIRVLYSDSEGAEHDWKQQFYFVEGALQPEQPGEIERGIWWAPKEAFVLKSADQPLDVAVIKAVEVFGYGSEFQSWITGISLVAR